jgi:hypothetical protein
VNENQYNFNSVVYSIYGYTSSSSSPSYSQAFNYLTGITASTFSIVINNYNGGGTGNTIILEGISYILIY